MVLSLDLPFSICLSIFSYSVRVFEIAYYEIASQFIYHVMHQMKPHCHMKKKTTENRRKKKCIHQRNEKMGKYWNVRSNVYTLYICMKCFMRNNVHWITFFVFFFYCLHRRKIEIVKITMSTHSHFRNDLVFDLKAWSWQYVLLSARGFDTGKQTHVVCVKLVSIQTNDAFVFTFVESNRVFSIKLIVYVCVTVLLAKGLNQLEITLRNYQLNKISSNGWKRPPQKIDMQMSWRIQFHLFTYLISTSKVNTVHI